MKIAVIQFPGSNCERETALAIRRANMEPVEFLWNESREKLGDCDGFVIVGGFSYEDRGRAGVIAAFDPLMLFIKEQAAQGKPILGICNGAQILVESGLVPGLENQKLGLALAENKRVQNGNVLGTGYYNAWVHMRLSQRYQYNAFTRSLQPDTILRLPVAHGEGRFVIPPALLAEIHANGLGVFQYCDAAGAVDPEFPVNPNGSIDNIAAISNKAGNVMAIMPHPERTEACDGIFNSMRDYILHGYRQQVVPLGYYPRLYEVKPYQVQGNELIIELIITDNHALTLTKTLRQLGIPAHLARKIHWEITCESPEVLEQIKTSGVLFNDRKEKTTHTARTYKTFLIRAHDDILGQQKLQMLQHHFGITGVTAIRHGILWEVDTTENFINPIIDSHILFNPYAHDCYVY